jgi:tetratricopeptide (TPR) repeat protein
LILVVSALEAVHFGLLVTATLVGLAAAKSESSWKKLFGRKGKDEGKSGTTTSTDPGIRTGDWQRAANIFVKDGRFRDAAKIYQSQGQNYEAARLMVQAGSLTEAATLFERVGHFLKAAEVYAQAGDNRHAAENYRRYLEDQFGSLAVARSPAEHAKFTHYCRLAGQAFERAGLLEQAAETFERGEHWEQAAELHEKLGRHVKAADLYQRSGAMDRAADVYARGGDRVRAAQMRGESLYKEDQKNEAAVQFLLGGDALRAAEVYEEAGNYLDAARCYEHCGAHRQAAEAYQRINEPERAAEMFERCQDYEKAGSLYEASGDMSQSARMFNEAGLYYRAAVAARKAGLGEQAITYLQKVKTNSADYLPALVQLAEHFMERDLPGVAVEKLQKALAGKPVSANTLGIYYTLAEATEQMGDHERARDILKKIVAEDYNFRDSVGKLQEIEKKLEKQASGKPVSKALKTDFAEGDRYEFKEKLGAGGMGVVYLAQDNLLKRTVAYKMLMEQFMEIEEIRKRFLQEAQSAAALNHPNIVTIFDMGVDRGRLFISMEYVEGLTYYQLLEREGKLPIPAVRHCMIGILRALAHAHSKGVVHRDIKPSNVMLGRDKVIKITDFGLAKILKKSKDQGSERASGTPLYMSPEQILGDPLDIRTDIYAFGGTVYHLLAGEPPFIEGEVLYHHVHTKPRPLREHRPDVSVNLEAIILKCLEKDPANRFQKAADIVTALRKS